MRRGMMNRRAGNCLILGCESMLGVCRIVKKIVRFKTKIEEP